MLNFNLLFATAILATNNLKTPKSGACNALLVTKSLCYKDLPMKWGWGLVQKLDKNLRNSCKVSDEKMNVNQKKNKIS